MDHILYPVWKFILNISSKNITNNPLVKIYTNKIKNRITSKINSWYLLELLTSETMELLGTTENKITKDENSKSVPYLEVTEVVSL